MPVIRDKVTIAVVTVEMRQRVVEQLAREVAGEATINGPIIFEIPLEGPDRFDVLVVWEAWKPFHSEDRSRMILEAYGARKVQIAQALGVDYEEAVQQQVLPYSVLPMVRSGEGDIEAMKKAMIAEGGIALPNGKVDLRFPTMSMAEQVHRRLADQLPKGYWSIIQAAN